MKEFQVAYIPIGVGTFHMESAENAFQQSIAILKQLSSEVVYPEEKIVSLDGLEQYLKHIEPDCIVLQNLTFANSAYTSEVMHLFKDVPVLLWTLREPVIDGTRLRLNSLTGAFSAGNAMKQLRSSSFEYTYGSPNEEKVQDTIRDFITSSKLLFDLKHLTIATIGHTPEGFGFGRALDLDLLQTFGVHQICVEARELIQRAKNYSDEEIQLYLQDAQKRTVGLDQTPEKNRLDFARLYRAYDEYVKENGIGAIASRCWPDFFVDYGTPVCAVLAMMNDLGIAASCETDTYGALSMWIAMQLSKQSVFFGDPVSLNEAENTITFWHCGTAACSLARKDTGAQIGEHCNRHIGPTMEFGCKQSDTATIFRIGRNADGSFRMIVIKGKTLDAPKQFYGTSVVVETESNAETIIHQSVKDGWEPHFVVAFDDIREQINMLANMLNIKVTNY